MFNTTFQNILQKLARSHTQTNYFIKSCALNFMDLVKLETPQIMHSERHNLLLKNIIERKGRFNLRVDIHFRNEKHFCINLWSDFVEQYC